VSIVWIEHVVHALMAVVDRLIVTTSERRSMAESRRA